MNPRALACGDQVLSSEVLDRIDDIVAAGRTLELGDAHAANLALDPANRRGR
ncbi:hypothetical protein PUR57_03790 [Streptomyces sp. JV176]|uniref:hypothetical protein n=1 Tax=Streptomyces sp. JV176 TaxID=858630 RepID=UPI002E76E878|nr:hypothetical protein [Streptomyces sp. JV176]MEE1797806.1 hypothetical protein [Streptomyces sp. JV176]